MSKGSSLSVVGTCARALDASRARRRRRRRRRGEASRRSSRKRSIFRRAPAASRRPWRRTPSWPSMRKIPCDLCDATSARARVWVWRPLGVTKSFCLKSLCSTPFNSVRTPRTAPPAATERNERIIKVENRQLKAPAVGPRLSAVRRSDRLFRTQRGRGDRGQTGGRCWGEIHSEKFERKPAGGDGGRRAVGGCCEPAPAGGPPPRGGAGRSLARVSTGSGRSRRASCRRPRGGRGRTRSAARRAPCSAATCRRSPDPRSSPR